MEIPYYGQQSQSTPKETTSILESRKRQRGDAQIDPYTQAPRTPDTFNVTIPDTNTILIFKRGSITDFEGESIVNAANEQCLGGGGVDGAITHKGGTELHEHRMNLPILYDDVRVPTGDARITKGGKLNASFCIHAVGPDFKSVREPYKLLDACYVSILREAKCNQISEIAFVPLSSGIFSGNESIKKIIKKGVEAIVNNTYVGLKKVYMYGFREQEMIIFYNLFKKLKNML